MSQRVLAAINSGMEDLGLHYNYMEWKDAVIYPYWVGEYQEIEATTEDGLQETSFLLTGFTRGPYEELENEKQQIEQYFNPLNGKRVIDGGQSAVAIFYGNALGNLPTGDADLKKLQINLNIKEWRVI